MRKQILVLALFSMIGTSAVAVAAQDTTFTLKGAASEWQAKDHVSISTDLLGFGYSSNAGFVLMARPKVEYFVMDRIAVGGLIGFGLGSPATPVTAGGFLEVGPSATFHFWEEKQLSAYGTSSFVVGGNFISSAYAKLSVAGRLNYNIDNVDFGPSLGLSVSSGFSGVQVGFNFVNLYLYF